MAPAAITPPSPLTPTMLPTTEKLTKLGMVKTISHAASTTSPLAELDSSRLTITYNTNPGVVPKPNSPEVWAQKSTTDHMLTASWSAKTGWAAPQIVPYGNLSLAPTASVLHYATECFEGMKAYRGFDGKLRLFRPERNCARMLKSATRVSLPAFDPKELQKLVERFVSVDGPKWLPDTPEGRGQFLYLRPTMIATNANIGVQKPTEALLYILGVCFPPLDQGTAPSDPKSLPSAAVTNGTTEGKPQQAHGMKLLASQHNSIRAWPGGFGNAKLGANYGPSLMAQQEARERGYQQILWLFGPEGYVTEAGASNFFVVWKEKASGRLQLVTAPLDDGVILEGVTRQSVLDLARGRVGQEMGLEVVERRYTMDEVAEAYNEGRLVEAFGSGTAFFIAPISEIHYRGVDVILDAKREVAMRIKELMRDIMFGGVQHPWGLVVEEEKRRPQVNTQLSRDGFII